jgi:hypothetical protein
MPRFPTAAAITVVFCRPHSSNFLELLCWLVIFFGGGSYAIERLALAYAVSVAPTI